MRDKEEKATQGGFGGWLSTEYPFKGTPIMVDPSPPPFGEQGRPKDPKRSWLMERWEETLQAQERRRTLGWIARGLALVVIVVGLSLAIAWGLGWGMR